MDLWLFEYRLFPVMFGYNHIVYLGKWAILYGPYYMVHIVYTRRYADPYLVKIKDYFCLLF